MTKHASLTSPTPEPLHAAVVQAVADAGGWMGFDRFMALALYAPGLGYYTRASTQIGRMPESGSDFVTAPELSALFGRTLARQVLQALQATATREVWEFGAGTGALALQLLQALDAEGLDEVRYTIVDLSGSLRARQQQTLAAYVQADRVRWIDALPDRIEGVVVGNEVLDAMPVQLLARVGGVWHERGVALSEGQLVWSDRPTALRPAHDVPGSHDYLTEIHPQAQAFVHTLVDRMQRGAVFFIDYGFCEAEYYHPQRHMGTVMCHRAHRADDDPLESVGSKDITAHVNFSAVALAAQDAGDAAGTEWGVLGYTSQGRFLINCGLPALMQDADLAERAHAARLIHEHEMGELFKVLGLYCGQPWSALGFAAGDRSHTL